MTTTPWLPMHQSATWKSPASNDGYDVTYSSTTITCRLEQKTQMIKTIDNQVLSSVGLLWTEVAVRPGDIITYGGRDFSVNGIVSEATDLDGVVRWRVVSLGGGKSV